MPRQTLDAKQLSILLDVVRCGSFSKAAEARNISQPAISSTIAALERKLGVRLLDRNRAGVTATTAGRILVRRAEALENQLMLAEREIQLSQSGIYGPLRIVGTPGALLTLAPSAIAALTKRVARFEVSIMEASDLDLVEMLRIGKADVVLSTLGASARHEDITEIDLLIDHFALVMRVGHELLEQDVVQLWALQDASWVLPNVGGAFRRQIDALLINAGLQIGGNIIRCDSLGTTTEIVRQTDYLALLPERVVQSDINHLKLASRPIDQKMSRRLGMRLLQSNYSAPVIGDLIEALGAAAR